jgi:hypothetical protein
MFVMRMLLGWKRVTFISCDFIRTWMSKVFPATRFAYVKVMLETVSIYFFIVTTLAN